MKITHLCFIVVVVSTIILVILYSVDGKKNQFRMNYDKISACNGFTNNLLDMSAVTLTMDENDNVLLGGSFDLKKGIEKGPWVIETEIFKDTGVQYVKVLSYVVDDFCPEIMNEEKMWYKHLLKVKPELPNTCPIAPGTHEINGLQADSGGVTMSREMAGKYRLEVRMMLPDAEGSVPQLAACYQIFLVMEAY